MRLPRILVVDDQIAERPDLRREYCRRWGVLDNGSIRGPHSDHLNRTDAVAIASFSSGQNFKDKNVQNSIEITERALRRGWPSSEGWRWSLILLDLQFDSVPPTPDDARFGLRLLDLCVSTWPEQGARSGNTELPVVMLSTIDRAAGANPAGRGGAREYVEKQALDRTRLAALLQEHGLIEDVVPGDRSATEILMGRSLPLLKVLREARRIGRMGNGNAMILGAPGTGKSSLAHYIHAHSGRAGLYQPYFPTATAEELEYAGLFGCWMRAHSTATESYAGKAEQANKGTLLVDEVHHIGARSQVELLEFGRRVGGDRWVTRLGRSMPRSPPTAVTQARNSVLGRLDPATSRIAVDVLLLSASTEPLDDPEWRKRAGFSDALYTRLAEETTGGALHFPTLAERPEDLPQLFAVALEQETARIGGRRNKVIGTEVIEELRAHSWPRNVAELMGLARRVAHNAKDFEEVFVHHLPDLGTKPPAVTPKVTEEEIAANSTPPAPPSISDEGSLTLANLSDRILRIQIDKDDPALEGFKRSLESAVAILLQRCTGAALSRWTKPDGKIDRIAAIRLLTGDFSLNKSEIPREIKRILGAPLVPTKVTDGEIRLLLEAWANPKLKDG